MTDPASAQPVIEVAKAHPLDLGHFELVDPASSAYPAVRDAVRALLSR